MKKLALSLLIGGTLSAFVLGQSNPKPPTIDVTGTAEIMVQPDEVIFYLDVTKRNKDMQTAKREADAALSRIIELTRRFNIRSENVKTDYISVEKKYQSIRDPKNRIFDEDGDEIGTRVFLGYDVSTTVIIRLTDIKRFEEFFGDVIKTGVSEIESVKFESSEMIRQRKKAREMAMKAAFEKASAMAGAINQTIGKAISVSEAIPPNSYSAMSNVNSSYVGGSVAVTEPVATFSPGAIRISSQVSVTFLLN